LQLAQRVQPIRVQLIDGHDEPLLVFHTQFPELVHYHFFFLPGGRYDKLVVELVRQDLRDERFEYFLVYEFDLARVRFYVLVALCVYENFLVFAFFIIRKFTFFWIYYVHFTGFAFEYFLFV
jgi:hypothetical protein